MASDALLLLSGRIQERKCGFVLHAWIMSHGALLKAKLKLS